MTVVRRIGIIGGECSGKSSLAAALAGALPACVVDEVLRDFVAREGRPPGRDEQAGLLAEQVAREDAAARSCDRAWLVCDPAPLMTAVYSLLYFDDPALVVPAVEHARGYALLAWCDPGIPWAPDGDQRDGAGFRARAEDLLARLVRTDLEPAGVRVIRAVGDVPTRVATVTRAARQARAWQPGAPEPRT